MPFVKCLEPREIQIVDIVNSSLLVCDRADSSVELILNIIIFEHATPNYCILKSQHVIFAWSILLTYLSIKSIIYFNFTSVAEIPNLKSPYVSESIT